MSITHHIKDKKVHFVYYRAGNLYYKTETGIEFAVPVSEADQNSATFWAEDKAIYFLRWISRHFKEIQESNS